MLGGPNVVQYHTGRAFPAHVDEINGIRESLRGHALPPAGYLAAAGIGWFATYTNCGGIAPAELRRELGSPVVSFPMTDPEEFGHPPGTRDEVFRVGGSVGGPSRPRR